MSEPLNDNNTVQPLYATLYAGPRNEPRVQVTLVEGVTVHNIGQNSYHVDAAYADVSLDYFRAWLREVSSNLDAAPPSAGPGGTDG